MRYNGEGQSEGERVMREIFEALLARLDAGNGARLVTVIARVGSAPREAGARMVVDDDGYVAGTIGGGTIEFEAIHLARSMNKSAAAFTKPFSLKNREAADLGMVCGGVMTLLFQSISPDDARLCRAILRAMDENAPHYLLTDIASGAMHIALRDEADCFCQLLNPLGHVFVFGAGHVARALVPLLSASGFRTIVIDDRADFADAKHFPDASEVRVLAFDAVHEKEISAHDYVVIMTRGHLHDQTVLTTMLKAPARYIGMMGSRHKRAFVYQHLRNLGFSETDIVRVHSPIGLAIGAHTPFEIALSIAAELILCRSAPL